MTNANARLVTIRGGQLPVWVQAGKTPTLVFLHYWGGSHRTFEPLIARVAPEHAVVSYDYRGWGAARELPGPYGIEQLADDVLDVVAGLGLGPYLLAGHSMGGKIAQMVASRRPEGLAGLVLIAPAPPRPAGDAQSAEVISHAYDSPSAVSDALQQVLTQNQLPLDVRERAIEDSLAADDDARRAWPLHGLTQDVTAAAGAIEVPVLVLAGQYDQVDPPASLEVNLLPFIPGVRMTVIEGTGHLSPLEVPDRLATLINEFAATVAPVRR